MSFPLEKKEVRSVIGESKASSLTLYESSFIEGLIDSEYVVLSNVWKGLGKGANKVKGKECFVVGSVVKDLCKPTVYTSSNMGEYYSKLAGKVSNKVNGNEYVILSNVGEGFGKGDNGVNGKVEVKFNLTNVNLTDVKLRNVNIQSVNLQNVRPKKLVNLTYDRVLPDINFKDFSAYLKESGLPFYNPVVYLEKFRFSDKNVNLQKVNRQNAIPVIMDINKDEWARMEAVEFLCGVKSRTSKIVIAEYIKEFQEAKLAEMEFEKEESERSKIVGGMNKRGVESKIAAMR